MRVFLDTNVALDTLLPGRPSHKESTELINLGSNANIRFRITSLSIADMAYCSRKYVAKEDLIERFKLFYREWKIISLGAMDIAFAMESKCPDFEDALQISAAEMESDVIVTNNKKHFEPYTALPVYSPKEFMDKLREAAGAE